MANSVKWLDRSLITGPRVALCLSDDEWKAAMEEIGVEFPAVTESMGAATQDFVRDGKFYCVVFFDMYLTKTLTDLEVACVLVHEAVHVWQKYCSYVGEDKPSKEFEAYSIEAISRNLMEAYCKAGIGE